MKDVKAYNVIRLLIFHTYRQPVGVTGLLDVARGHFGLVVMSMFQYSAMG